MNKIYIAISKLRSVYIGIAMQYTKHQYKADDAVQELMLYFLKVNPDTLKDIYSKDGNKGLIKYGAVAIRRMFTSKTSSYYYTYKRYDTIIYGGIETYQLSKNIDLQTHTWELYEKLDIELDKMYWYDRELYKLYYSPDGETLDSLAKKTGISRNSLFTTIDNVRKHLIKVLKDE